MTNHRKPGTFSFPPVHARSQSSRSGQSETIGLESRRGGDTSRQRERSERRRIPILANQRQPIKEERTSEDLRFEILDFVFGTKL